MKKNFSFSTSLFIFLFIISSAHAQNDSLLNLINDFSENESYWTELLYELQENPINLNDADKDELLTLPLLTSPMADTIIVRRQRYGSYRNKRQIRSITGPALYNLIKNYIMASQKKTYKLRLTQRTVYKIEKIREIESGKFKGSALNNYTRLTYQATAQTSAGLLTQKDAGEKNWLDHYNFYIRYTNKYWNLIFGNFYLQLGEGLSHSNSYGNQKSIYLSAVFRKAAPFARPKLTGLESSGKFGLFIQNDPTAKLTYFSFYSNAYRDAQLTGQFISGFKYDGFHRSQSELNAKNSFKETNWGAGIRYDFLNTIQLISFFNQYTFSKKIEPSERVIGEKQKRRQYFSFSGSQLSQVALTYSWQLNHFKLSGEMSASDRGKPAWLQSIYYAKDKLDIGLKYWYLNNSFQSVDGRSFDSSDPFPQGLKGFFTGVSFQLNKSNTFSAFKKFEQRLWRSYFNPMPTSKNEWLAEWDLHLNTVQFVWQFRTRTWEDFITKNNIKQRIENVQKTIRLQLSYSPVKNLNTRSRWQQTYLGNSAEKGSLFFQEFNFSLNPNLSLNTRFTFFSTSSFATRIFEYERDLPGTFSNVALFGNGNKLYILLKYKFVQKLSLWIKWRYVSKDEIFANGEPNKVLNRDLRLQIQTML